MNEKNNKNKYRSSYEILEDDYDPIKFKLSKSLIRKHANKMFNYKEFKKFVNSYKRVGISNNIITIKINYQKFYKIYLHSVRNYFVDCIQFYTILYNYFIDEMNYKYYFKMLNIPYKKELIEDINNICDVHLFTSCCDSENCLYNGMINYFNENKILEKIFHCESFREVGECNCYCRDNIYENINHKLLHKAEDIWANAFGEFIEKYDKQYKNKIKKILNNYFYSCFPKLYDKNILNIIIEYI